MAPALRDDGEPGRGERSGTNAQMINVLIMFKGSLFNLLPTESYPILSLQYIMQWATWKYRLFRDDSKPLLRFQELILVEYM